MTTQKKQSSATANLGVNYTRQIVEAANCTFQPVDLGNDLGNDAYIEFVRAEQSTGICIATQIKSGASYVAPDGSFLLRADRDHFEYWSTHSLPVCGIAFDPARNLAVWCDITEYLRANPHVIEHGPYQIKISAESAFSSTTFAAFQHHFATYAREYSSDAHFGASLGRFTPMNAPEERIDALRSLFNFHRNRVAMWVYIASLLRSIEDPEVLRYAVWILAHLPGGGGDILWHKKNIIDPAAQLGGTTFIKLTFGRDELVKLLSVVDEHGFERGAIGQFAHSLIHLLRDVSTQLHSVAFDGALSEDIRYAALLLFIYYVQQEDVPTCAAEIASFRERFPGERSELLDELTMILCEHGSISFY